MMLIDQLRTRQPLWLAAFFISELLQGGCIQSPEPTPPTRALPEVQSELSTRRDSTAVEDASGIVPRFVEVASDLGIHFALHNDAVPDRYFLPEVMGSGAAWIDFDGDGWLDLFLADGQTLDPNAAEQHRPPCRLWRNHQGVRFEEVTQPAHVGSSLYGQGCAVGDYNADGFPDLYVAGYGPDHLFHNQGDGTFVDVTDQAIVSDSEWTSSAMWIDIDGDRNLDLYAVNYLNVTFANRKVCDYGGQPGYCGPGSYEATADKVYLSQGDGTFEEATDRFGFRAEDGKGLAVAAADFDDDLIPEIYVANDMTANFLFKRTSTSSPLYREVATEAGCAVSGSGLNEASMGISLADFDGDGRCDIYLTHYYHMKNTLYKNLGGLLFDDISNWAKVTATSHESLGFGTAPFDFDRDGDPDLFVANGHVLGPRQQPNEMKPQLLRNDGGQFTDISSQAGPYFHDLWLGRSVAAADFDNDGDIDLAVTHLNKPFVLLRNETKASHRPFIGFHLLPRDRGQAAGGKLILRTSRSVRTIPITCGGSYLAAPDTRILLGWPAEEHLESIEILWPSGFAHRLQDLAPGRYWDVMEGHK